LAAGCWVSSLGLFNPFDRDKKVVVVKEVANKVTRVIKGFSNLQAEFDSDSGDARHRGGRFSSEQHPLGKIEQLASTQNLSFYQTIDEIFYIQL
jgi:hypothetical protein